MDLHVAVKRTLVNEIEPPAGGPMTLGKYVMRILMCSCSRYTFSIAQFRGCLQMIEIFECPVSYDVMPNEVKTHVDEINRMGIDIIDIEHLSKGVCDGSETVDEWTVTSYNYLSGQIHAKSFSIFDECAERNVKTSVITLPATWATRWAKGVKAVNQRGGF